MGTLILMRHGQSAWNEKNIFTGWVNISLSSLGIQESLEAGKKIAHLPIDHIFTSALIRTQMTACLAMSCHSSKQVLVIEAPENSSFKHLEKIYDQNTLTDTLPLTSAWQLNERMYGELQGLNKKATVEKFGEKQVQLWRRSYATPPPGGESLKDTANRTLPYFKQVILPYIKGGKTALIVAHGNSLRAILMEIEQLNEEQVVHLELNTAEPLFYQWEKEKWHKKFI